TEYKPEPTADGELTPAMDTEPELMFVKKPEPAAMFTLEHKPQCKSHQVCEPAASVPVGVSVELDRR
ncbi:hypothetical protein M9458_026012, partial [Cirrhinus mrigala]